MTPTHPIKGVERFDEIVVYGGRGHSQTILNVLQGVWNNRVRVRAVVDDLDHGFVHPALGVPVISGDQRLAQYADLPVLLSMGSAAVRANLAARLTAEGATLATAIDRRRPDRVDATARFGAGCIAYPETLVSTNVVVGAGVQVMATALAHDVKIGDFATLGFGSIINGHVNIGSRVTIGSGAIICNGRPGRPLCIGDDAVIGIGAVVMRDVPAGARMMGNPAMTVREWARLQALVRQKG